MRTERHIEAIELYAEVLGQLDEDAPPEAFHDKLCEVVCRLTPMERALVFHHDVALRRVRAVGAHGLDLALFRDAYVTPDTAPIARQALEEDRVIEVDGDAVAGDLPAAFQPLVRGRHIVCAPMTSAGHWVGVVLADRAVDAPPVSDEERDLLWTLGKVAALAAVARSATRQVEKARQLLQRIDLARDVHDGVVQRLFGVSLALSADVPLGPEQRERCATEIRSALEELRSALQRPLGRAARPTQTSFAEELERLRAAHGDLHLTQEEGDPADVPSVAEPLAQSVLAEALRNARKHAAPTRVAVRTRNVDDAFFLEVENDGVVDAPARHQPGMGLRLAAFEALQCGGVLEFGPRGHDRWQVRLVVPVNGG
jgi:signal transduction histidine kinase